MSPRVAVREVALRSTVRLVGNVDHNFLAACRRRRAPTEALTPAAWRDRIGRAPSGKASTDITAEAFFAVAFGAAPSSPSTPDRNSREFVPRPNTHRLRRRSGRAQECEDVTVADFGEKARVANDVFEDEASAGQ